MVNAIARDAGSIEFFDAAARGILVTKHCQECHGWSEPAALRCPHCHSTELKWQPTAGKGTVASWVGIPPGKGSVSDAKDSIVVIVELKEGPWVTMAMPDVDSTTVGSAVTIDFVQPEGGEYIPIARLDS